MSLQLLLGNAGSGKTYEMYQQIVSEAAKDKKKNFLVIVPEQFTMQTQRELVSMQPEHVIMNIDVLSFERLAYRVFDELGKSDIQILEETGKNLVLRKVAENKESQLEILKTNMKKTGYISEVKSLISEFMQYQITPEELETFAEQDGLREAFRRKLHDIAVMYDGFLEYLQGNYITGEELLSVLADMASQSEMIKNSVIVLDGYTGFTPVQLHLLKVLLPLCERVYVTVTIDAKEDFYHEKGMQELFFLSKHTIADLIKAAEAGGVEVDEPIVFENGAQKRYAKAEDIFHLEQHIFRKKLEPYTGKQQNIKVVQLTDKQSEIEYVARTIKNMVREQGYRYRDFAIVCAEVESYANYAGEIFEKYEIPLFMDQKNSLMEQPFVEVIRAVLAIIHKDYSYDSIMRYLKMGFSGFTSDQIDDLENYLLACGIRGHKKWTTKWVRLTREMTQEQLAVMEEMRQKIADEFEGVYEIFHKKGHTLAEQIRALYDFIEAHQMQEQLKQREEYFTSIHQPAYAKEYAQIYKIVMDLLDKMVALLGDEVVDIAECEELLDAGFEAEKIGIIPPANDCVQLGDIERSRTNSLKVLFMIGVNDGVVPKSTNQGGIISDQERERINDSDLTMAPGARQKAFVQRFYLYLNLTKPQEKLYLTYTKVSSDGKAMRRSYIINQLMKLFPKLNISNERETSLLERIVTKDSAKELLIEEMKQQMAGEKKEQDIFWALYRWYEAADNEKLTQLWSAISYRYESHPMAKKITKALYGKMLQNSVSRMEKFAACAFAHFLNYGLKLKEREEYEFASSDFGTLLHDALEQYTRILKEQNLSWKQISEEVKAPIIEQSFQLALLNMKNDILSDSAKTQYMQERMLRIFKRTIWAIENQVQKSDFEPEGYEIRFSGFDEIAAASLQLDDDIRMNLRGRIDRIDKRENGDSIEVQVVDYKTGNTKLKLFEVYYGLQLQLMVYMDVALEVMKKKYPNMQVNAKGAYYYHIDDPIIASEKVLSNEEIDAKILKELELQGQDIDGITSQYDVITKFVDHKMTEIGNQMMQGEVAARPYRMKTESGCDYCPYHAVCGFDRKIGGCEYHELKGSTKEDAVLAKMAEELHKKRKE